MTERAPAPMTRDEIAALAELERKATPGEWVVSDDGDGRFFVLRRGRLVMDSHAGMAASRLEKNVRFIASARNAVPRLIATIAARDAEIAELRHALNEARDALNGGMNTVGLHHQIAAALKEPRHD